MAVQQVGGGKRVSVILPERSEIELDYVPDGIRPNSWMIDVEWMGRPVCIFLVDLLDRGERLDKPAR